MVYSGRGLPKSKSRPTTDEAVVVARRSPRDFPGASARAGISFGSFWRVLRPYPRRRRSRRRYRHSAASDPTSRARPLPHRKSPRSARRRYGRRRSPAIAALSQLFGFEAHVFGVQVTAVVVRIDAVVTVGGELPAGLVIEPLAQHVHGDDVLPIGHPQARGARLAEHGLPGFQRRFT